MLTEEQIAEIETRLPHYDGTARKDVASLLREVCRLKGSLNTLHMAAGINRLMKRGKTRDD